MPYHTIQNARTFDPRRGSNASYVAKRGSPGCHHPMPRVIDRVHTHTHTHTHHVSTSPKVQHSRAVNYGLLGQHLIGAVVFAKVMACKTPFAAIAQCTALETSFKKCTRALRPSLRRRQQRESSCSPFLIPNSIHRAHLLFSVVQLRTLC